MEGVFSGPQDATGSPSCEEVALVLQKVVCPLGLTPSGLAKCLHSLSPLLELDCVRTQTPGPGAEDAARAVAAVVKEAVGRLHQGAARDAAGLLLGITRMRGLPRKDRRKAAADVLAVGEAHFRKRRELALLTEVAEEICALELRCRRRDASPAAGAGPTHDRPLQEAPEGRTVEAAARRLPQARGQDLRVLLPDPVASFTGRVQELRWLAEPRAGPVVVTQALAGLGGVGKTALALEYAHRCFYDEHSVDLAWWFPAADRLSLIAAMARLYEQLTGASGGEESVLGAERLRNWLETSPHRWLVVFDNADDPRVLDGLVPHAGTGKVLITSRCSDWSLVEVTVRHLDVLPPDDAVTLLHTLAGRDDERGARLLARELDGLAVALRQAGAFIRKTGRDYERYVEMLRARPQSLHGEDLAGVGTTVAKVWESSLDQVMRSGRYGTLAGDVLGVLAYFAAEDIPRFLLASPAIDGEATLGGGDTVAVELALVGLADYSLVSLEADAIGVHRVVQHLTRVHVESPDAASGHVATAIRLLRSALAGPGPPAGRTNRLLPHIAEATDHAARLSAVPEETTSLLNTVVQDRLVIGQLDIARRLLDRAQRVAIASLGPDHPDTLATRDNLASLLGLAGRADEAVAELQPLLEDRRRVLGADHPDTLASRTDLAYWLGKAGRVGEAVAQLQALLEDHSRVLGPDHPQTLWTRNNVARWLGEAGRVGEAVAQLQAVLEDHSRVLGPDHPQTLWTRNNLAYLLGEAGRAGEAVAQLQPLLEDRRRVLGADHPDTLASRNNLAYWLGETGRVDEAVAQLQTLLEDHRRALGPDHPHTLRARHTLAHWLGEAGRVEEAVAQFQAVLEDRLRVLGPDHPQTLRTRHSLARWMGEVGGVEEALAQFQAVLEDQHRVLGPHHLDTLRTRQGLAHWLGETGRVDEAVSQLQALLEDQRRVLCPDHPDTLGTRQSLAGWMGEAGRVDEAIAQLQALLEDDHRVLGPDHPHALRTRSHLAHWLGETGRVVEAIARLQALIADQRRVLCPDHPGLLRSRNNLARWLGGAHGRDEAGD